MHISKKMFNHYLMDLRPYKTVSQEIWSLPSEEWGKTLKLDWNESTIEPAPAIKKAVLDFVSSCDFFRLYPATFNRRLTELLAQYAGVPELNVQYFPSSDTLHEYIARLFVGVGDKVLMLWPSYDNFRSTVEVSGAQVVYSNLNPDFEFNLLKFKTDIAKETPKLVYICNPNNPTGLLIPREQIQDLIRDNPATMFLIDEAYAEFASQSVNDLVLDYDNILVTHTLSKAFGLASMRFGYLVSSADNIDAISRIRNPKNIQTISQVAAIAAFEHTDYMRQYVGEVNSAREWFYNAMNDLTGDGIRKVYPSKSNFLLIRCKDINTRSRIYYALREKKIYIRQLSQCASVLDCIRITIGTRTQMEQTYHALCEILNIIEEREII